MKTLFALCALLCVPVMASAGEPLPSHPLEHAAVTTLLQAMVTNPRAVEFECADHAVDDQHELDIIATDGTVVQTILLGDPAADATTGVVHADINVQPVAFGQYTVVVRAVAGTLKSDNSEPSEVWARVPGAPSKVVVK